MRRFSCAPLIPWQQRIANAPHRPKEAFRPEAVTSTFFHSKSALWAAGVSGYSMTSTDMALGRYLNDGKKHIVKYDLRDVSRVCLMETDDCHL